MEQEDTAHENNESLEKAHQRPRAGKSGGRPKTSESRAPEGQGLISKLVEVVKGRSSDTEKEAQKARQEDPVRMLKQDHRKVEALFEQYEKAGDGEATRKDIVDQISRELEIHAQVEERIFYQAFKSVSSEDPKKVVRESFEEHKIVKTLIAELAPLQPGDEQFEAKVTVLKESVEHHVEEEEDELFPAAEKLFGDDQMRDLAARMREMKTKLSDGRAGG